LEQQREAGNEELQALSRQLDQLQCEKRTAQDSCRRSERRLQEKRNEIRSLKAEIRTLSTQLAAIQQSMLVDTTPLEGGAHANFGFWQVLNFILRDRKH
jgi:predicted  nucleic acid-binding Zn-ribbon protein